MTPHDLYYFIWKMLIAAEIFAFVTSWMYWTMTLLHDGIISFPQGLFLFLLGFIFATALIQGNSPKDPPSGTGLVR